MSLHSIRYLSLHFNSYRQQVTTPTVDRPLKPVADVFMFIEDKKADYKKKYPTMDENELHRFMVKEFNCISERDKVC